MSRIQQDVMALVGMTTPTDTFTPEVMDAGNSGAKLQLAMGPNQIIQDNQIKNCAEGLKDAIWLVWRTLIQYSDDYGVKKLAAQYHPKKEPVFLDGKSYDDMDFCERKIIHIDLALGMASEENALQRLQIIKQIQTQLAGEIMSAVQANILNPESFAKMRRPYEDMMYVLNVKECDVYLPTEEEVMKMVQQSQQAASQKQPSPQEEQMKANAALDQARTQEIMAKIQGQSPDAKLALANANKADAETAGTSAGKQLDAVSLIKQHKATNY
jgi:hypothetical protein